uniref:Heat shock factor binding protein 1b n=1 Tax=Amphilophus citrinellus TaxID=61819 RepID=A0A3Q0RD05_AMPCI
MTGKPAGRLLPPEPHPVFLQMHTCRLVHFLMLPLDQMGTRINDLEKNVTELMTQAGMEEQPSSK